MQRARQLRISIMNMLTESVLGRKPMKKTEWRKQDNCREVLLYKLHV